MTIEAAASPVHEPHPWPRGVDRTPSMSIGAVVERLRQEFPAITTSKVRFLEERGIVAPVRTATGYRKFSEADVERLRFCLSAQRDSYLPIRAILDELSALDAGHEAEITPTARVVVSDGELVAPARSDMTVTGRELRDLTGISREELDAIVSAGLVTPDAAGYFPHGSIRIVQAVGALRREGIAPRNLRYLKMTAQRHADLIDQVTSRGRMDRSGADAERRHAKNSEIAEIIADLATTLLRGEIEQLS